MNVDTPSHVYLDITVSNNAVGENQQPTPLAFYTRRDQDYLFKPNEYFVSVVRWSIDCRLPLVIPQIPLGASVQVDGAGAYYWPTIYYISIKTAAGAYTQENVRFYPEITSPQQTPPRTTITNVKQLFEDPYFYISSVSWWLYLVNRAMTTCYTNFFIANPGVSAVAPYMEYQYDGTFKLIANSQFLNGQSGGGNVAPIQIWFNSPFYTQFQFPNQYSYTATLPPFSADSRLNYLILFNSPSQTAPGGLYYTKTEMPSLPFWNPLSSIVFCSQAIPIEPTNVTPTIVLGSDTNTDKSGTNNNINVANVISDFEINQLTGIENRTIQYYVPSSDYRLIDILGSRPLSEINITVFWRDKLIGSLIPLYLHSGGAASLKLLFRKRNFYSEGL